MRTHCKRKTVILTRRGGNTPRNALKYNRAAHAARKVERTMATPAVSAPALEILARFGREVLAHASMQETKRFAHHAHTSVFAHSVAVAYVCVYLALKLHMRVDMRALVRGALLHDYFLYDWHAFDGGAHRLHGFFHAGRALVNARADFALSPIEENAIRRHMFPLTPIPPRCREAWLVCLADKACALCEALCPARLRDVAPITEARALRRPPQAGDSSSFQA